MLDAIDPLPTAVLSIASACIGVGTRFVSETLRSKRRRTEPVGFPLVDARLDPREHLTKVWELHLERVEQIDDPQLKALAFKQVRSAAGDTVASLARIRRTDVHSTDSKGVSDNAVD